MFPAFPGPVLLAVIEPPLIIVTPFVVLTFIDPPVALGAVPDVAAEIVPLFWMVSDCTDIVVLPPAPVPTVLVKIPLPAPSISTEPAGPARPWIVIDPAAPVGEGRGCPANGKSVSTPITLPLVICPPFVNWRLSVEMFTCPPGAEPLA